MFSERTESYFNGLLKKIVTFHCSKCKEAVPFFGAEKNGTFSAPDPDTRLSRPGRAGERIRPAIFGRQGFRDPVPHCLRGRHRTHGKPFDGQDPETSRA